jgi:signal transduction histidine kinase
MMRSITTKLMLVFLAVSLVIITLIFGLASRYTNTTIRDFYIAQSVDPIAKELVEYYAINHSWDGVANRFQVIMQRDFPEQGSLADQPVLYLTDVNGVLIYPKKMPASGMHMMDRDVRNGVSLVLDGEKIGTLVFITRNYNWEVRQPIFLARINRLLYSISAAAIILAIILGSILSPRMTRPIRELTAATKAAAAGDLSHKVKVRSDDELGELAESFNTMNSELDRLITARKQMTADIAHELRTPISIILGNTDGIRDGVIPMSRETFDIIAEETERLNSLVEDLHTLSRAEAGELPMNFISISVQELIDALHLPQFQATQSKTLEIIPNIESDLPLIKADPDRMIQVLRNLLNNAYHYTPENGWITLTARQKDADTVRLSINDTGPGVAEEELERIFNRFYRTDTSRQRDGEGSGLGLAIARSIVDRHGGKIWAENRPEGGLSVIIDLPVDRL